MAFEESIYPLDVDEDFHLHHLQVYGREGMRRISKSKVLVIGMQGLGAEIAKQVILAGMKAVTLQDEGFVESWDLCGNFLFTEEDIGKNRALASLQKLQKLNKAVDVSALTTKVTTDQLSGFQAVVYTDISLEKAIELNDYCHEHKPPIAFIKAEVRGLFGGVFCDFGPAFTFPDEYKEGGKPILLKFEPLKKSLLDSCDHIKSDRTLLLLHFAFQALDQFVSERGCFPKAGSEDDAQLLISLVEKLDQHHYLAERATTVSEEDALMLQQFAFGARAVLSPMATIFGGIVGQEVIKACSRRFFPIIRFCYLNSVESLPSKPLKDSDFTPLNSRYDAQISVFGHNLQKKLEDAKAFIVGSGALAGELLKNMALMGVSCGDKGKLTINDGDNGIIEKKDLSSHFLFREGDIGLPKSTVAANSAKESINQHLNVEVLQNCVGLETENVFDDAFRTKLDVVVNALDVDSFDSKAYVDKRCLHFMKPFLESATHGTQCSTHMVIPHLTENYVRLLDPPKKLTKVLAPCIATSNAVATGLVCLELYKVIDAGHNLKEYRNANMDLAVPFFNMVVPVAANSTQEVSNEQRLFIHTVHQIFMESGFVALDFRARKVWPMTTYYSILGGGQEKIIKVTFCGTNKTLKVAAETLFSRPSGVYEIIFNEIEVLDVLRILWSEERGLVEKFAHMNAKQGEKLFHFWRKIKDHIIFPSLVDIGCRDADDDTLIGVLRIMKDVFFYELLNGVDIGRLNCVCKDIREMTSCNELWEKKCHQDFRMGSAIQAQTYWKGKWKLRYATWRKRVQPRNQY